MSLSAIGQAITRALPHTVRIIDPKFVIPGAILTRVGIGALRIEENLPFASRKPEDTRYQRWSAFFQRVWIEMVGVPAQFLSLLLSQDAMAALTERTGFLRLPNAAKALPGQAAHEVAAIDAAIQSVYKSPVGLIAKQTFKRNDMNHHVALVKEAVSKTLGAGTIESLSPAIKANIDKVLIPFHKRLWWTSTLALSVGVLWSAYFSGAIFQWLNDNPISKKLIPRLTSMMGVEPDEVVLRTKFDRKPTFQAGRPVQRTVAMREQDEPVLSTAVIQPAQPIFQTSQPMMPFPQYYPGAYAPNSNPWWQPPHHN